MPEIGMSSSMSGDGKRGAGHRPQATAPILDSTASPAARTEMSALLRNQQQPPSLHPNNPDVAWRHG